MSTFAMICDNRVIEIIHDQEGVPNWPPDPSGNPVMAVVCPDEATRNWVYNKETGEVTEPVYMESEPRPEPQSTQLDRIEALAETAAADNAELIAFYEAVTAEVEA